MEGDREVLAELELDKLRQSFWQSKPMELRKNNEAIERQTAILQKAGYQRLQELRKNNEAIERQTAKLAELRHQANVKKRRRKKNGSVPLEH